jgi:hypothetical protein
MRGMGKHRRILWPGTAPVSRYLSPQGRLGKVSGSLNVVPAQNIRSPERETT